MNRVISLETWIQARMAREATGHDWFHVDRVRRCALNLAALEGDCDLAVVSAAALLHDFPDRKLHPNPDQGMIELAALLDSVGFIPSERDHILEIIDGVSYRGVAVQTPMRTLEGRVVQDADRLDALGAIGIARCFAYGGKMGRALYDPEIPPVLHTDAASYYSGDGPSLNHFYEKLFLLKDRMCTESGKKAAAERHRFLEEFVSRFLSEWNGSDQPR